MKYCQSCKQNLDIIFFWKNKTKRDGLQTQCKKCSKKNNPTKMTCDSCSNDFFVEHRNIKNRKTCLCKSCLQKKTVDRIVASNKLRAKDILISIKGYEVMKNNDPKSKYIFNHRRVVEKSIGRKLNRTEVVHHIDLNKFNNDIRNLWLTDAKNHSKAHASLTNIAVEMIRSGDIVFDIENGIYKLTNNGK